MGTLSSCSARAYFLCVLCVRFKNGNAELLLGKSIHLIAMDLPNASKGLHSQ